MSLTNIELENKIELMYISMRDIARARSTTIINKKLSGFNELDLCLYRYVGDWIYPLRHEVSAFIDTPETDAIYMESFTIWENITKTNNRSAVRDYLTWTFAKHGLYYTEACDSLRNVEGYDFYDTYKLNKQYDHLFNLSACNRLITTQAVFIEHGSQLLMCNKFGGSTYTSKGKMFRNMVYFNQTRTSSSPTLGTLSKESKLDLKQLIELFATTEDLVEYCSLLSLDIEDQSVLRDTLEPVFSDICEPTKLKIALDTFFLHKDARTFVNSVFGKCEIISEELPTFS